MQISLNIKDDLYNKIVSNGVDMQTKFNEYLLTLLDKKEDYVNSKQFQEDKKYFHDALNEIESGKVKPIPFDNGLEELDNFIDNVK